MKRIQENRPCGANKASIDMMSADIDRLVGVDIAQWDAINQLRRLVYMGVGGVLVAAFIGSIVGNILINYLRH